MIRSFGSKDTERIWHEQHVEGVDRALQRVALRKLELIHAAKDVEDLRIPPRNRLERFVPLEHAPDESLVLDIQAALWAQASSAVRVPSTSSSRPTRS